MSITRREFGQILGAAAMSGALPDVSLGTLSDPTTMNGHTPSAESSSATADELCTLTAVDLAARIRRKQVSAREVMAAHLARIERVNPKINAIVTLVADRAMADAAKADEQQAKGATLGPLRLSISASSRQARSRMAFARARSTSTGEDRTRENREV